MRWNCVMGGAAICLVVALGPLPVQAGDPPKTEDEARLRESRERAGKAARAYEFRSRDDAKREFALRDAPILRWTNPVGMRKAKGDVFLWTDRGRAAVVLSIYEMTDPSGSFFYEDRELCSLALGPFVATSKDHGEWRPSKPGVSLKSLPGAGAPRSSRALRLRQMRELAERFTADKTTRQDVVRDLRLLPQPVYRYEGDHPDLLDAALFAFVEGTDPEAFLLLEARKVDGGYEWQFALARMTSVRLRAYDRGKEVWEAPRFDGTPGATDVEAAYTVFRAR
jgi:hypothetical protein